MNVTGIIAEYNPFHSGHAYHIEEARRRTGADFIVVAMSGDFVQRGGPALFDKYTRAHMALLGGADLVLELPSAFACSSAEEFAACGVALLDRIGITDCLCFGSEHGDTSVLLKGAEALEQESSVFSRLLQNELKTGATFPAARLAALKAIYSGSQDAEFLDSLSAPNNILGLEYCKAILRQNASLMPVAILRKGDGYHDAISGVGEDSGQKPLTFASATGIRTALFQQFPYGLPERSDADASCRFPALSFLPETVRDLFCQSKPLWPEDFSSLLNGKILELSQAEDRGAAEFGKISDISSDLALRLSRLALDITGWEDRIAQLKTRQYTYTRINRAFTKILLGIAKEPIAAWKDLGYAPYARILGFNKGAAPLFAELKKSSRIPLITKPAAAFSCLSGPALEEFQKDLYASHLYQCAFCQRYPDAGHAVLKNEFNRKLLVLE